MGSGLGLGERRWGLSSTARKAGTAQTVTGNRTGEPPGGLVRALCLVTWDSQALGPHPERGLVWQKGRPSLGESSLVLVTAQLLIVSEKHGFWFIHQRCELGVM